MPEGDWIEEGFVTRGTCQPYPKVHSAYMCTDGSMWGWWPLCATFNPALIHPLDAPNCRQRGIIWAGIVTSRASGAAGEGTFDANPNYSTAGAEASGVASWCSCGVQRWWQLEIGGAFWVVLGWRTWRNVTWLPTRAHTNLPPPILPQLTESCSALLPPSVAPPPLAYSPIVTNPNPERRKRNVIWQVRLNHKIGRA